MSIIPSDDLDELDSLFGYKAPKTPKRNPLNLSPLSRDEDLAIRTIIGEAKGEGVQGWNAVAGVIRNRSKQSGKPFANVVLAPNQFEPWGSRRKELEAIDPNSPVYQKIANVALPVLRGEQPDPTGGSTHFYSPTAQASLGRKPPSWDNGKGMDIGNHRFFRLGYSGKGLHGTDTSDGRASQDTTDLTSLDALFGYGKSPSPNIDISETDALFGGQVPNNPILRPVTPTPTFGGSNPQPLQSGVQAPIPESPETIIAQIASASDANAKNKRVAVLATDPAQNALFGNRSDFLGIPLENNRTAWVHRENAKKVWKLTNDDHIRNYVIKQPNGSGILKLTGGDTTNVGDNTGNNQDAVTARENGVEQATFVTPTDQDKKTQAVALANSFPKADIIPTTTDEVAAGRIETLGGLVVTPTEEAPTFAPMTVSGGFAYGDPRQVQSGVGKTTVARPSVKRASPALSEKPPVSGIPTTEADFQVANEYLVSQGQAPLTQEEFNARKLGGSVDILSASIDTIGDKSLAEFDQETPTAGGGFIRTPRQVSQQEDNNDALVKIYRSKPDMSEEDAFRDAALSSGYGITPEMVNRKIRDIRAAGKPLFSTGYHPGNEIGITVDDLEQMGAHAKDLYRMEQVQNRVESPKLSLQGLPTDTLDTESEENLRNKFHAEELAKFDKSTATFWLNELLKNPLRRVSEAYNAANGIVPDIEKTIEERIQALPKSTEGRRQVEKYHPENDAPFAIRKVGELSAAAYKGFVVDNFASMLETSGMVQSAFNRYILGDDTSRAQDTDLFKSAAIMRETHEKGLPKGRGGIDETFARTLGQAAGTILMTAGGLSIARLTQGASVMPSVARQAPQALSPLGEIAAAAKGIADPVKAGLDISKVSMISGAVTGVTQMASEAYRTAIAKGATEDQANLAALLSAPGGFLEGLSEAKLFTKLNRIKALDLATDGKFSTRFMARLKEVAKTGHEVGVTELIEEGFQGLGREVADQIAYRKNDRDVQDFLKDVDETLKNALIAYPVGALLGGGSATIQTLGQPTIEKDAPTETIESFISKDTKVTQESAKDTLPPESKPEPEPRLSDYEQSIEPRPAVENKEVTEAKIKESSAEVQAQIDKDISAPAKILDKRASGIELEGRRDAPVSAAEPKAEVVGEDVEIKYKPVSDTVDGLTLRDRVPNQDSIAASLTDYEILSGIREVPMSEFNGKYEKTKRTKQLARDIEESGEINPLIVVIDSDGAYILEGAHRFDALGILGKKSIPAMVVIDKDVPQTFDDALSNITSQDVERMKKESPASSAESIVSEPVESETQADLSLISETQTDTAQGDVELRKFLIDQNDAIDKEIAQHQKTIDAYPAKSRAAKDAKFDIGTLQRSRQHNENLLNDLPKSEKGEAAVKEPLVIRLPDESDEAFESRQKYSKWSAGNLAFLKEKAGGKPWYVHSRDVLPRYEGYHRFTKKEYANAEKEYAEQYGERPKIIFTTVKESKLVALKAKKQQRIINRKQAVADKIVEFEPRERSKRIFVALDIADKSQRPDVKVTAYLPDAMAWLAQNKDTSAATGIEQRDGESYMVFDRSQPHPSEVAPIKGKLIKPSVEKRDKFFSPDNAIKFVQGSLGGERPVRDVQKLLKEQFGYDDTQVQATFDKAFPLNKRVKIYREILSQDKGFTIDGNSSLLSDDTYEAQKMLGLKDEQADRIAKQEGKKIKALAESKYGRSIHAALIGKENLYELEQLKTARKDLEKQGQSSLFRIDEQDSGENVIKDESGNPVLRQAAPHKKAADPASKELLTQILPYAHFEDVVDTSKATMHDDGTAEFSEGAAELQRRVMGNLTTKGEMRDSGASFYGITLNKKTFTLVAKELTVNANKLVQSYGWTKAQVQPMRELAQVNKKLAEHSDYNSLWVFDDARVHELAHRDEKNAGNSSDEFIERTINSPIAKNLGAKFRSLYPTIKGSQLSSEIVAGLANIKDAKLYGWDKLPNFGKLRNQILTDWADDLVSNNQAEVEADPAKFREKYSTIAQFASKEGKLYAETKTSDTRGLDTDRNAESVSELSDKGDETQGDQFDEVSDEERAQEGVGRGVGEAATREGDQRIAAFSRIAGEPLYYDAQGHGETEAFALNLVSDKGTQRAISDALTGIPSAEGMRIVYKEYARLNALYDYHKKQDNEAEAETVGVYLADLADGIIQRQRATGREVEIAKTLNVLSPDIAMLMAARAITRRSGDGTILTPKETALTQEIAKAQQELEAKFNKVNQKLQESEAEVRRLTDEKQPSNAPTSQNKLLKEYRQNKTQIVAQLEQMFPDSPLFNGASESVVLRMVADNTEAQFRSDLDPVKIEVLTKFATGQILEGTEYESLIKTLEELGLTNEDAQQIHSDAVDVIKPARSPQTTEAKERVKIRNEHYRKAKEFSGDGKPKLSGIAQDAQNNPQYKDNETLIKAIDYLTNVNVKGRNLNDLINGIRKGTDMSIKDAEHIAAQAKKAVKDLQNKRAEAKDIAEGISAEQRKELNLIRKQKTDASKRMSNHLSQLGGGTQWWMKRANNISRGLLVSNYFTQLFNSVASTVVTTPAQVALDGIATFMKNGLGIDVGANQDLNAKDLLLPWAYIFANNKQLAEQGLAHFPEQYFRIHAGILGDIEIDKLPQADTAPWLTKPLHKLLDKADAKMNSLTHITGAKLLEMHHRNAIIAARFNQIIKAKSKDAETHKSSLENGTFLKYITEADAKRAADDAMQVTMASEITDPVGKKMKEAYDLLDNFVPLMLNPVTFARFTYTTTVGMVANPLMFGALDIDSKYTGGRGYNNKSIAKGVLGWGGVIAAYALKSALGGDDDRWDTLYINGKDQPPLSIKRFFPLSAYFYVAHLVRQGVEGKPIMPTMNELLEGFASLETDYYTYGAPMQLAGAGLGYIRGTSTAQDVKVASARALGNFFAMSLRFFVPLKQAVSAIDKEEATLREDSDSAKDQFINEVSKSLPLVIRASDAKKKIDPLTDEVIMQPWPLGRAVGLNFVHPAFLKNKDSAATEWANKLFAQEFGNSKMSAQEKNAYFIRKRLREAVRSGKISDTETNVKALKYLTGIVSKDSIGKLKDELKLSELQSKIKATFTFAENPEKAARSLEKFRKVWSHTTDKEKDDLRKILRKKENKTPELRKEFGLNINP